MFSTELLRDFFAARGYGVFAAGREEGLAASLAFRNAITAVSPPTEAELAQRAGRRLLFYARPEPHAARNMFDLGVLGLTEAISRGTLGPDWELSGVGSRRGCGQHPAGPREHTRAVAAAAAAGVRRAPRGARRGVGADAHAAPEPGADRDGRGRHAHGDQHLRDEDRRCARGDRGQPDPGCSDRRGHRRRAGRGGCEGRRTRPEGSPAPPPTGPPTGTTRSARR